jgi:hypothetical protein
MDRPTNDSIDRVAALGEHFAHLVVLVGMVLVLVGIVADGIRSQRRVARREGAPRHALR